MYRCECGREFKTQQIYDMHKPYCKGPLYCQNPECNNLLTKYQQKFCSASCSAKMTVKGRKHSNKTKSKISRSLGGNKTIFDRKCINCNKSIKSEKFCSTTCQHEYKYKQKVKDWLENPEKYKKPQFFMKRYLIEKHGEACTRCGWNEINIYTDKIPLEMHHEDGNWKNNDPDNLHLICPNCHSLTETYRYGNKGNGRKYQRKYYRKRNF